MWPGFYDTKERPNSRSNLPMTTTILNQTLHSKGRCKEGTSTKFNVNAIGIFFLPLTKQNLRQNKD